MKNVKERMKYTASETIKLKHLIKVLSFNPNDWDEEQVEKYKEHTMINMMPVHDCMMVFRCDFKKETKTSGGIIIPDTVKQSQTQAIGFVLGKSPEFEFKGGMKVNLGDFVLYDNSRIKFYSRIEGFDIPMLDSYSVMALLPPSIIDEVVLIPSPLTAFRPDTVDLNDEIESDKAFDKSMPSGMQRGYDSEQTHQVTDTEVDQNALAEERGEKRK